jgi:hypothetical protein
MSQPSIRLKTTLSTAGPYKGIARTAVEQPPSASSVVVAGWIGVRCIHEPLTFVGKALPLVDEGLPCVGTSVALVGEESTVIRGSRSPSAPRVTPPRTGGNRTVTKQPSWAFHARSLVQVLPRNAWVAVEHGRGGGIGAVDDGPLADRSRLVSICSPSELKLAACLLSLVIRTTFRPCRFDSSGNAVRSCGDRLRLSVSRQLRCAGTPSRHAEPMRAVGMMTLGDASLLARLVSVWRSNGSGWSELVNVYSRLGVG